MSEDSVIGIVVATLLEADPFIKRLLLEKYEDDPFAVYGNDRVRLILSGIGKANAAMACTCLIMTSHPRLILNVGAAGAADSGYLLGECCHISKVIEPDRPDIGSGKFHVHLPQTFEGFQMAVLATQDRPVTDDLERREVSLHAQLVDMEGASVIQTCARFQTRCYLFKFVSDAPDDTERLDIQKNILQCRKGFCDFFCDSVWPLIIKAVSGRLSVVSG